MMLEFFENLESGLSAAIENGNDSPRKIYTREIARLGVKLYSGKHKVTWCGVNAPFDLLNAMNVTPCFVEFIGAMLASSGMVGSFIDASDQIGYSSDACSYHRAVMGATLNGLMPVPEVLIGTTNPCTGGLAVLENLAGHFKKNMVTLHIPQDDSGGNVAYLADQYRDLAGFISDRTGQNMDRDVLAQAVAHTNEARRILLEVYDLAKQVPSPVSSRDLGNFGVVMALFLGTEAAVTIARSFRDEFQKRVDENRSGIPDERFRILWVQNRIQFKHPLETLLADEYKASIVSDELNDITWEPIDPAEPYEGMARRAISIPLNGPLEKRVDHLKKLAEDYKVDGVINPCNWGCRQGTGARGMIEKGLKDMGVPVLNLDVDCIDHRKFTEGQFKTRIEAFVEMMDSRKC